MGGVAGVVYPSFGAARVVAGETPRPEVMGLQLAPEVKSFELDEITIDDLQDGMKSGKYTSRLITEKYLARIEEIDKQGPAINSVIEVNSDAVQIAESLDRERKQKGARGPLHGIPILNKDNITKCSQDIRL